MIIFSMIFILFIISFLIYYLVLQKKIWDQIIAVNAITNLMVLMILLFTILKASSLYIDAAIIYSFLSFIGSIFILVYVYKRGDL